MNTETSCWLIAAIACMVFGLPVVAGVAIVCAIVRGMKRSV